MRSCFALLCFALLTTIGCKDHRYVSPPPPAQPQEPAGGVIPRTPIANPADLPPGKVEVDTSPGGVKVDVDAPALRERIEERREAREAAREEAQTP